MMTEILDFVSTHRGALEAAATVSFGWIMREIPVVYRGLKTNGGVRGLLGVIMNGQTPEKQAAVAVAQIAAISPAVSTLQPTAGNPPTKGTNEA